MIVFFLERGLVRVKAHFYLIDLCNTHASHRHTSHRLPTQFSQAYCYLKSVHPTHHFTFSTHRNLVCLGAISSSVGALVYDYSFYLGFLNIRCHAQNCSRYFKVLKPYIAETSSNGKAPVTRDGSWE